MNIASLWDQLVDAVCRPPRDVYDGDKALVGGTRATFSFGESRNRIRKYYRQDVELINCHGQRLQCSHYRPCVVTSKDGRLPCVVYCHTNSGSRRDAEEIIYTLLPKSITVFCLDFAGSGLSDGDWVSLGAHEVDDLQAAVEYLRQEGSTSTLALWGRSMGAVTALLYTCRDPSIAGVVADSPFSRLVDLMLELATDPQSGISVPRPLIKVAMSMMRRSVRRRAKFNIDDVSPLEAVPSSYVPTLFGHGADDTFVPPHHSEKLFVAHGSETKNYIAFEGEHNGIRPDWWYSSALIFLLSVLRVEELVGPEVDLHSVSLEEAPHMMGRGIYVVRRSQEQEDAEEGDASDEEGETVFVGRCRPMPAPWDTAQARSLSTRTDEEGGHDNGNGGGGEDHEHEQDQEGLYGLSLEQQEEEMLQRVLEMSLAESHKNAAGGEKVAATVAAAVPPEGDTSLEDAAVAARTAAGTGLANITDDEEAQLARAIEESLKSTSPSVLDNHHREEHSLGGHRGKEENKKETILEPEGAGENSFKKETAAEEHAGQEAAAAHRIAVEVQHAMADVARSMSRECEHEVPGAAGAAVLDNLRGPDLRTDLGTAEIDGTAQDSAPVTVEGEDEASLEALRAEIARLQGFVDGKSEL